MTEITTSNPLYQPVAYNGKIYFTSHYFHQQYRLNKTEDAKYAELKNFNALVRNLETYESYVSNADIVEADYKLLKLNSSLDFKLLKPLFEANSYRPIMLINATAQIALTHHLDDEVSKAVSVRVNEQAAKSSSKKELSLAEIDVLFLESAARMLRFSDSSIIRGMQLIAARHDASTEYLPSYVQESLTKPISRLLESFNIPLSAKAANPLLQSLGYLTQLERPSKSKGTAKFWSITEKGLPFGRNETSIQNPRETQPMWFEDKFAPIAEELLALLETHE